MGCSHSAAWAPEPTGKAAAARAAVQACEVIGSHQQQFAPMFHEALHLELGIPMDPCGTTVPRLGLSRGLHCTNPAASKSRGTCHIAQPRPAQLPHCTQPHDLPAGQEPPSCQVPQPHPLPQPGAPWHWCHRSLMEVGLPIALSLMGTPSIRDPSNKAPAPVYAPSMRYAWPGAAQPALLSCP